ncbi:MAG: toll/interleukin-1 receptor domain-containing protein, partial [Gammaproteobacteria bacterium]|nr:toll/interleukin-1 receptor domain-containing protein [Gammaproteobacteria bacterium]
MSVFISHSTDDDAFVKTLRLALESRKVETWVDSRRISGGDQVSAEVRAAIARADQVLVVFSSHSVNSQWVLDEIDLALQAGKKLIPLCFPAVRPALVKRLAGTDPAIIEHDPAQPLSLILPGIFAALGKKLPDDIESARVEEKFLAELLLKLCDPEETVEDNKRRFSATAELSCREPKKAEQRSKRFKFTAPLGPIERGELSWYLEHYFVWPVGVFKERGAAVEAQLPEWGKLLYNAAMAV